LPHRSNTNSLPRWRHVRVGPERPRLLADDHDRHLAHPAGQKVADFRDLLDSPDIVPTRRKDAFLLAFE
jgi:hypothetical protein